MTKLLSICLFLLLLPAVALAEEKTEDVIIAKPDVHGVQKVDMTGGSYYFKPNYIVVKKNMPVRILLKNDSTLIAHNFVIDEPDAGMEANVEMNGTNIAEFIPRIPGKYKFYCDRKFIFSKSHRQKGMEGTIEVVE